MTVSFFYPKPPEFLVMPKGLATPFTVGLVELACIRAVNPYLDWPDEQTVGTGVNLGHLAATPPGLTATVPVKLEQVEGKELTFSITADDGVDKVSEGTHERFIINTAKFNAKTAAKAGNAG